MNCTTWMCRGLVAAEIQHPQGHWLPYCTTCAKGQVSKYGKTARWLAIDTHEKIEDER